MDRETLRERLASLDRRELIGLVVIAALIVGGIVVWYMRSLPRPVEVVTTRGAASGGSAPPAAPSPVPFGSASVPPPPSTAATATSQAASPTGTPTELVVDVAGWVRHPGVYRFEQGDRVVDAIHRAGGAKPGADLASLNLAALLTDAEQVVIGRANGAGPPSSTTTGAGSFAGSAAPAAPSGTTGGAGGALININTATLDQLETLPGIGPALGQRIIDYREQHGPFHAVEDLLNVSGIGDARLADIKDQVTV